MNDETIWSSLSGSGFEVATVSAGGHATRLLQAGSGSPLVLLHGTGGHAEAYARNLARLARHHRVVVPDLVGHGYSDLAERDLEIDHYIDHVNAILEVLGLGPVHLSGESLGGWVAARLAARHPERVRTLVLNTPGGTRADPAVMKRIRVLTQEAVDDPTDARIRARLEWLMADPAAVTDELVAVRQAIYRRPGFARSMRHVLCLQDPAIRGRNLLLDEELAAITAPTRVVWTTHDPSGPTSEGRSIADSIPGASFGLIERAGHWPQWEQPEEFERLLLEVTTAQHRRNQP